MAHPAFRQHITHPKSTLDVAAAAFLRELLQLHLVSHGQGRLVG